MVRDVDVRCRCGEVKGVLRGASPASGNRVRCFCDDCQAFLHHLGRAELLDRQGGSDIVQVAPSALEFTAGHARIEGLRLSPKGLYRWYATCCHTPLGNTVGPAFPFVGIVTEALAAPEAFGPSVGDLWGKYAVGEAPPGATRLPLRLIARSLRRVLGWKLAGRTWPHPFFDRSTRAPRYPLTVLGREERDALRLACGPRPTQGPLAVGG